MMMLMPAYSFENSSPLSINLGRLLVCEAMDRCINVSIHLSIASEKRG